MNSTLAFSASEEDISLWAFASKPFVIVAAVRKLRTAKDSDVTDYGVFMPTPLQSSS